MSLSHGIVILCCTSLCAQCISLDIMILPFRCLINLLLIHSYTKYVIPNSMFSQFIIVIEINDENSKTKLQFLC